jgi:hypothetical protein
MSKTERERLERNMRKAEAALASQARLLTDDQLKAIEDLSSRMTKVCLMEMGRRMP